MLAVGKNHLNVGLLQSKMVKQRLTVVNVEFLWMTASGTSDSKHGECGEGDSIMRWRSRHFFAASSSSDSSPSLPPSFPSRSPTYISSNCAAVISHPFCRGTRGVNLERKIIHQRKRGRMRKNSENKIGCGRLNNFWQTAWGSHPVISAMACFAHFLGILDKFGFSSAHCDPSWEDYKKLPQWSVIL